jgi:hypothetical protein
VADADAVAVAVLSRMLCRGGPLVAALAIAAVLVLSRFAVAVQ